MSGLFDKLNVLLRSGVNHFLDDVASSVPRSDAPRNESATVDSLRERINRAVEYEQTLTRQIDGLITEINGLNEQADRAIAAGQEAMGRHLIAKIKRREQYLDMLRADLAMHQRIAEDLILQVNQLDAAVASHQHAEQSAATPEDDGTATSDAAQDATNRFRRVLDEAQGRIDSLGEKLRSRQEVTADALDDEPTTQADSAAVDDELEARRDRLAKR
ncbi:MAG: hypothetical protein EA396_04580 [Anaerolineaceae bacterium]|nr:MAG: hypothetical protein EA396_04580 [Anaerolineaceae bacterium]